MPHFFLNDLIVLNKKCKNFSLSIWSTSSTISRFSSSLLKFNPPMDTL